MKVPILLLNCLTKKLTSKYIVEVVFDYWKGLTTPALLPAIVEAAKNISLEVCTNYGSLVRFIQGGRQDGYKG